MPNSSIHPKRPVPTLSVYVRGHIRDAILSGEYPIGSKLDQQAIADKLGVSIIPVRESLLHLQAEGLVQSIPHRGVFVTELSLDDLHEIYVVRETLEELATILAVPKMNDEVVAQLSQQIDAMEVATESNDFDHLFELNRHFHFTIYRSSGNNTLLQMIESLWDRSTVYRRVYTFMSERDKQALAEHKTIFTFCKSGDPAAAGQAVRENVQQTTRGIMTRMEKEHISG